MMCDLFDMWYDVNIVTHSCHTCTHRIVSCMNGSFAKEPYARDYILQKRHEWVMSHMYTSCHISYDMWFISLCLPVCHHIHLWIFTQHNGRARPQCRSRVSELHDTFRPSWNSLQQFTLMKWTLVKCSCENHSTNLSYWNGREIS